MFVSTKQVTRWQHWGLHLKGLCTPSYSLTLEARDAWQQQRFVAAPGRKRDVTPVKGSCSQTPGSRPLGWSFCTRGHTYPGLREESLFQHGQRGGHGGQAGQGKDQLSPAAPTAAYPMFKKQEHGALCPEQWPPPQYCQPREGVNRKSSISDDRNRDGQKRDKSTVRVWCPSAHMFQESLAPMPLLPRHGTVSGDPRQEDMKGKELYVPACCVTGTA